MKKFLIYLTLGVVLVTGVFGAIGLGQMDPTYDGTKATVSVYELQQDPESYDDSTADGAAAVIVQQNLATTHAQNDVTSIVFDFRGYDTMGESFVLILSISGVIVLLRKTREEKAQMKEERHGQ